MNEEELKKYGNLILKNIEEQVKHEMRLKKEIEDLNNRIQKAIEYIEEIVSDTKGIIDTYNYEDKEETIKRYIEDLETDIKHYEYLLEILKGGNNE